MSEQRTSAAVEQGYEPSDVNVANVGLVAVALYAVIALVGLSLWGILAHFYRRYPPQPTPQHAPVIRNVPPLETNPPADLRAFNERARAQLDHYGWVDPQHGIVRIPIARAMQLYAERAGAHKEKKP